MEDVPDVYHRPYDEARPLICIDEQPKQLVSGTRAPLPPRPGDPAGYDYEYRRGGANPLMLLQPLLGWRYVMPTERRTAKDFAEVLRRPAEGRYPDAGKPVPVTDSLNTRSAACLYEASAPARAGRVAARLEWRDPPKRGSWLSVAEVEFAARSKQCLDRRVGSTARPRQEVAAWEEDRNERTVGVNRRSSTPDARIRLQSLYPPIKA
jgi:hypothetical protein